MNLTAAQRRKLKVLDEMLGEAIDDPGFLAHRLLGQTVGILRELIRTLNESA